MWVKWFIFFHNVRHPAEMTEPEINAFLARLAVKEQVSASTQRLHSSAARTEAILRAGILYGNRSGV